MENIFPFYVENAEPMAKYMKNKFEFAGVKAPQRKELSKPLFEESKSWSLSDLVATATAYYALPEREYQYLAIDLMEKNMKRLDQETLQAILPLVQQKEWWDSIDAWRKVFAEYVRNHPAERETIFNWFYGHEDFWMRRIAINLQLKFKDKTDLALLEKAILLDQETDEFFIQKAIGWSLREYSKTDPDWVREFLCQHQLSKLAVREGSKYLDGYVMKGSKV